ncbi:MAG TPA: hypothetical protein VND87_13880 [Stellaceae bacterium]|nr:hypothetical protein [Stellaceae bacterium]
MTAPETDLMIREARAARRLGRLFRAERAGGYDRRPAETVWRLVARRGDLLAELAQLERRRRALGLQPSPELAAALRDLAHETAWSRGRAEALAAALADEIAARRHLGEASGLRGVGGAGRLLGQG